MDAGDLPHVGPGQGAPTGDPEASRPTVLPYARQWIDDGDIAAVTAVLRSDFLTQGPAIERFETALAAACGATHAVAVSSGTAALHLVNLALGMGPGRVGITSPITFAASANGFLYAGAAADFADVDPDTGLMTLDALEKCLARHAANGAAPGVVVAVSLAGAVPDLPGMERVCREHGWALVEDAAHSLGAEYSHGGRRFRSASCAHTTAAILSFHPVKHVCAGEGGAILTNDEALARHLRRLRTHGIEKPAPGSPGAAEGGWFYEQVELGYHYRLTDIQAALGASQLQRLPAFLTRRRELASRYSEALAGPPFDRVLRAPSFEPGHAYHLFVVHFRDAATRRAAYDWLAEADIRAQVHYIPVYRHPYYQGLSGPRSLPGAEAFYSGCLSLPLFPKMSDADQTRVIEALSTFCSAHG